MNYVKNFMDDNNIKMGEKFKVSSDDGKLYYINNNYCLINANNDTRTVDELLTLSDLLSGYDEVYKEPLLTTYESAFLSFYDKFKYVERDDTELELYDEDLVSEQQIELSYTRLKFDGLKSNTIYSREELLKGEEK